MSLYENVKKACSDSNISVFALEKELNFLEVAFASGIKILLESIKSKLLQTTLKSQSNTSFLSGMHSVYQRWCPINGTGRSEIGGERDA